KALRTQFHTLWYRARQRKGLRVFALGQRLRHFVDHVTATAGPANGERVRRWVQDKKAGWYAVLEDPQMPATSTLCVFHGFLPLKPRESCHPVHVKTATWTTGRLPPNPGEACHPRSAATLDDTLLS